MSYVRVLAPLGGLDDPASLWAEFDSVRTDGLWGMIDGADVAPQVVENHHLVPPRVRGFPVEGADGEVAAVFGASVALDGAKFDPDASVASDRVNKWQRFDLFHVLMRTDRIGVIPGLTKVVRARRAGTILFEASWSAISADDGAGATPPTLGSAWGYFVVVRQRRPSGSGTAVELQEIPHSRRDLKNRYHRTVQHFHTIAAVDVSGSELGDQTLSIAYVRDGVVVHTSGNAMLSVGIRACRVRFTPG